MLNTLELQRGQAYVFDVLGLLIEDGSANIELLYLRAIFI
jgi:hypothetical protein